MEIAACAVASFSDDQVDGTFDVGVVLMDRCGDIAVGDGRAEIFSEPPLLWKSVVASGLMLFNYGRDMLSHKVKSCDASSVHSFNEGIGFFIAVNG